MVAALAVPAASLAERDGRTYWLCPRCRKVLAEVDNGLVLIECARRHISVVGLVAQTCRCGASSQYADPVVVSAATS